MKESDSARGAVDQPGDDAGAADGAVHGVNPHRDARFILKKELEALERQLTQQRESLDVARIAYESKQEYVTNLTEKAINLRATIALLERR